MSGTHRARSRRKKTGKGKALPAVLATAVAVAAVGVTVFLVRSGDEPASPGSTPHAPSAAETPRTGAQLEFTNTEDFSYSIGAIKAGLDADNRAYIDYLITNTSGRTAPFEAPGQLFLPEEEAGTETCAPQEGAEEGMCTPPIDSEVIGTVGGVRPSSDGVDDYMPKDSSFVVRVITKQPVAEDAEAANLRLYVWDVRFVSNRIAQGIPLP